ncbi:MAG: porin family protein [Alphaproteobacteria bacterium]
MKYAVSSLMVAVSALAFSANANASDFKPYVGLDYNYTDADADHQSPKYNSASVNVGTEYNKYFGTEVFYQYSDDDKKHVNGIENQTSFQAYGLDLMGYLPLGCDQVFSLVGTMGIGEYTFDKNYSGFYAPKDQRDHGIGYRFGGGLQYKIDDKFSVRGLVRYVNLNDIDNFDDCGNTPQVSDIHSKCGKFLKKGGSFPPFFMAEGLIFGVKPLNLSGQPSFDDI